MTWWKRDKQSIEPPDEADRHVRTEGLWIKCEGCGQIIWRKTLEEGAQVCPKCGYHFRIDAVTRLKLLFDDAQYEEFDQSLVSTDPLRFFDSKSIQTAARVDARINTRCRTRSCPPAGCSMAGVFTSARWS